MQKIPKYVLTDINFRAKLYEYVYIRTSVSGFNETVIDISIHEMEVLSMANIKSAKKRILVNRTKADRNKAIKSGVKTAIKKVYTAIEANDKEAAAAALLNATSVIDKATSKGVYHKNYASRKVSRLSKAVNQMA